MPLVGDLDSDLGLRGEKRASSGSPVTGKGRTRIGSGTSDIDEAMPELGGRGSGRERWTSVAAPSSSKEAEWFMVESEA